MSSERLREAADRLDAVGALWGQWANVDPAFDRAAAALLRAVADTYPCPCGFDQHRFASCRWHNVAVQGHDVVASASALADAVLGTPHCCADWECGFATPPDRDHCGCFQQVTHPLGACQRQGRKRDGSLSEVGEA